MVVAMVQTAPSRVGDYPAGCCSSGSATRRFLAQPKMRSVIMVIAHVIGEQLVQVSLVDSDNVVEQITAAASRPALSHSVLPGLWIEVCTPVIRSERMAAGTSRPYFWL